jgi:hypothetical protein
MTEILRLANSEDGLEAIVTELSEGTNRYRVKFRDTDADETIATLFLPDREYALQYARNLIEGTKP